MGDPFRGDGGPAQTGPLPRLMSGEKFAEITATAPCGEPEFYYTQVMWNPDFKKGSPYPAARPSDKIYANKKYLYS